MPNQTTLIVWPLSFRWKLVTCLSRANTLVDARDPDHFVWPYFCGQIPSYRRTQLVLISLKVLCLIQNMAEKEVGCLPVQRHVSGRNCLAPLLPRNSTSLCVCCIESSSGRRHVPSEGSKKNCHWVALKLVRLSYVAYFEVWKIRSLSIPCVLV